MINFSNEHDRLKTLAEFDFLDVCLLGETGTGKSYTARLIHDLSPRSRQPFIAVNCAELTPSIIEAELFGYEKGAFTGAVFAKKGKFEAAAGGTLFLDEVGELPLNLQAKLLKVTEEKWVTRVGGNRPRRIDVRIIYATNRDLTVFRDDLRYRVAAHTIRLKPLRERPEDIIPLAQKFVSQFNLKSGTEISIGKYALLGLERTNWDGNIRELRTIIEKGCLEALLRADRKEKTGANTPNATLTYEIIQTLLPKIEFSNIKAEEFYNLTQSTPRKVTNYKKEKEEFDRSWVEMALVKNNGNVSHTAVELNLSRYGLIKKLKRYKIQTGK